MIKYISMFATKGSGYKQVKDYSHYLEPIDKSPGRPAGNSRRWGDASHDVQRIVIDSIIEKSKSKLNTRQTAHILAIAYVESGFNLDAASNESAAGIGQFLDGTGEDYGLDDSSRFDLSAGIDALILHYLKNRNIAIKRGNSGKSVEERIYQYHHDGPGSKDKNSGLGLRLSKERVLPITDNIEMALKGTFKGEHVDPACDRKKKHAHNLSAQPRTNKKYIDPASASTLHPHAAEISALSLPDYYTLKVWNIPSRYYWRIGPFSDD